MGFKNVSYVFLSIHQHYRLKLLTTLHRVVSHLFFDESDEGLVVVIVEFM